MFDEEKNVEQLETPEEVVEETATTEEEPKPDKYSWNAEQENIKNVRRIAQMEAERAQREAERAERAERRLQELERSRQQPDDDDIEENDDIVEKKDLKRVYKKQNDKIELSNKKLKELEQSVAYYQQVATDEMMKNKYKGYATIVNDKNIKKLEEDDPILYNSIMNNKTYMERCEAAYKILKPHLAEKNTMQEHVDKLEANKARPKSAATVPGTNESVNPLATYKDQKRWKPEFKYK